MNVESTTAKQIERQEKRINYMIIRKQPITPQRGNKLSAQGIALGKMKNNNRPERAKAMFVDESYAHSGHMSHVFHTQGDALGYVLVGLSDRLSDTCG